VLRTIVIGVLASIGTAVLPLPATAAAGISGSTTVGGVVYALELVVIALVSVPVLVAQWRRRRAEHGTAEGANRLILGYAVAYLAVMAVLWATALPAYLDAADGVTAAGDPIGSLWYTVVCFAVAGLSIAAVWTTSASTSKPAAAQEIAAR
jgi:hypothetical protein